jgi:hypothetical protein
MGYIIKDTQGLVSTRLTDVGRRKISQGNFNISYFQVGDSEIDYSVDDPSKYNILMPSFNAHNDNGANSSNKHNVKYPYFLGNSDGTTYGIPFNDAVAQEFFNIATSKGFFVSGATKWEVRTNSLYTVSSNYSLRFEALYGSDSIFMDASLDLEISGAKMNQIIGNRLGQKMNGSSPSTESSKKAGLFTNEPDF